MIYSIEFFRQRIGLDSSDGSRDADIEVALSTAFGFAELYCDRKFEWQAESETFTHFVGDVVSLIRFPLTDIIDVTGTELEYHFNAMTGLIVFDGCVRAHELIIDYEGGYHDTALPEHPYTWPPALAFALLVIFDNCWSALNGQSSSVATGMVKSIKAGADLGITYETANATTNDYGGLIPAAAAAHLNLLKREKA